MTDDQPRYTTKRLHDEIAKAREYGRQLALEEAATIAEGTAKTFDLQKALADCDDQNVGEVTARIEVAKQIRALINADSPPPADILMGAPVAWRLIHKDAEGKRTLADWRLFGSEEDANRHIHDQPSCFKTQTVTEALYAAQPAPAEHMVAGTEERGIAIGMAIAAGIIMRAWGKEGYAREILGSAGLDTLEKLKASGVDQYDIDALMPAVSTATEASGE